MAHTPARPQVLAPSCSRDAGSVGAPVLLPAVTPSSYRLAFIIACAWIHIPVRTLRAKTTLRVGNTKGRETRGGTLAPTIEPPR
jgi:hypothetical protein